METKMKDTQSIQGSGGGGGKKQKPPKEAPNTLQSASTGKILDLLAYGPIKGVVGGAKGVYLEDTPVENPDGTSNFEGVSLSFRVGNPDQAIIKGFNEVSNVREINTLIRYEAPISRTITNADATSVLVTLQVQSLLTRDDKSGDTNPTSVPFTISVYKDGAVYDSLTTEIRGKTTSAYERSYRLDLPSSGAEDVTITVQRNNKESEKQNKVDAIHWTKLNEVIDVKHNYPGCALVGVEVDARLFSEALPSRKYLTDLSIVQIPSNYDPYTRKYTGVWDGTFVWDWTDNPAWCFYDLATHPVIGAGIQEVNKFALYEIAKYCDELVDDGFGGKEPRFTCNTLFTESADAIEALNTLASVFRGMTYWGSESVEPVADMPGPVRRIISPSDVVDGAFEYSGTPLKDRHSVVSVSWNDPDDNYDSKPEVVELPEAIALLGYKQTEVTAVACTSRGQARRLGLWILYSEHYETQMISFEVTVKNADLRPGDFIEVADPYRAGTRLAGRVLSFDRVGRWITLDDVLDEVSIGWYVTLEGDDKSLTRVQVIDVDVEGKRVRISNVPPKLFAGCGFFLSDGDVTNQQFRVLSVVENDKHNYVISAGAHHPGKYDFVEKGLKLPDRPTTMLPSGILTPPKNLEAESYTKIVGGTLHQNALVSWEAPDDPRVTEFILDGKGPEDIAFVTLYRGAGVSFDVADITAGQWAFRVRSVSESFGMSSWLERSIFLSDGLQPIPPTELIIVPSTFTVRITPVMEQYSLSEYEFWRSTLPLTHEYIESNAMYLGTSSGSFVDDTVTFDTDYYYYVRAVNAYGKSDFVAGQTRTLADVEEILEAIVDDVNRGPIGQWFNDEIDKISGEGPGSINDRIDQITSGMEEDLVGLDGRVQDITDTTLPSLNEYINEMRESLESEIAKMAYILAYDESLEYGIGDVVRGGENGMRLYQAKKDVPLDTPPPDEEYWEDIGAMFADTSHLVQQVQVNTTRLEEIDGELTAVANDMRYMTAAMRPERADGEKADSLEGWMSKVEFTEQIKIQANENEALGQYTRELVAHVNDNVLARLRTEELVRASEDEALALQITTLQATVEDDIAVALQEEREARATSEEAFVRDITHLQGRMGTAEGDILNEQQVRLTADEALAGDIQQLQVAITNEEDERKAAILNEQQARIDQDGVLLSEINLKLAESKTYTDTELGKEETARKAAILSEQRARITGDEASTSYTDSQLSQMKTTIDGEVNTKVAAVQNDVNTKTGPNGSLARSISTLQTQVNGQSSSIQQISNTTAGLRGDLQSMWGVKLEHNSRAGKRVVAGVGLNLTTSGGVSQSEFVVRADRFVVMNNAGGVLESPFAIQNNKVIIKTAIIGDATITMAKIGGDLFSTNFVAGQSGWRLRRNGTFEINGSVPGRGRITINNEGMVVRDANNRIRVKLGKL